MSTFLNWCLRRKWRLARAHVLMDAREMEAFGFETACALTDEGYASKLYYCRYMSATTRCVEFKLLPACEDDKLLEFLRGKQDVRDVTVEPWDGSGGDVYAQAFALARMLRGKGDEHVGDVAHWLLNMTGYSYVQELQFYARGTATVAGIFGEIEKEKV